VQIQIDYTKNPHIFRPSGVDLSLSNGDQVVWQGSIRPLEPNQLFVTYISPLPPATFHRVFGQGPVTGMKWDKLEYHDSAADLLGASASRIKVEALQCLDSQKFLEVTPAP
jgi:hypothetical protein